MNKKPVEIFYMIVSFFVQWFMKNEIFLCDLESCAPNLWEWKSHSLVFLREIVYVDLDCFQKKSSLYQSFIQTTFLSEDYKTPKP